MFFKVHTKPLQPIHINYSLEYYRLFDIFSRQKSTTTGIQQRELDEREIIGYYRTKNTNYEQKGNTVSLVTSSYLHIFLSSYFLIGKETIYRIQRVKTRSQRHALSCALYCVKNCTHVCKLQKIPSKERHS